MSELNKYLADGGLGSILDQAGLVICPWGHEMAKAPPQHTHDLEYYICEKPGHKFLWYQGYDQIIYLCDIPIDIYSYTDVAGSSVKQSRIESFPQYMKMPNGFWHEVSWECAGGDYRDYDSGRCSDDCYLATDREAS